MTSLHSGTAILKNDWECKLKDYLWFGHIRSESGCLFRCLMRSSVKNNWKLKNVNLELSEVSHSAAICVDGFVRNGS